MKAMWSIATRQPLTVLMTADTIGGVWQYSVRLCGSLPENRFIMATMGPRARQTQRAEIGGLDNVVLVESDFRLEWMAGGDDDFFKSRNWLIHLIETYGVDLVHVNGFAHAFLGIDCPALVVAHSDVLSWWEAVHKAAAPTEWDAYRRHVAAGLAAATRVAAPTAAVLRDLERHYPSFPGNATVVPNGIDLATWYPLPKRQVILAAGRIWDAAKNLAVLDAVASDLAWPVEIAGNIAHPEGGTVQFANVRLLGSLSPPELTQHLGNASIFVAPARYEPFGFAILEAAAAGCALVLGSIPSLRENWDGVAIFVDPEDRAALKAAINRLIARPEDRVRAAMAAQYRAKDFSMSRTAQAYDALYREIVRSSARLETA
jgi:glycosyltransferase involved in cell wall biosynthesis